MKKFLSSMALVLVSGLVLAQESSSPTFDLSQASTAAQTISDSVYTLLTGDVMSAVYKVAAGLFLIWVFWRIFRWCGLGRGKA